METQPTKKTLLFWIECLFPLTNYPQRQAFMFTKAMYSTNVLCRAISKAISSVTLSLPQTLLLTPLVTWTFFFYCNVIYHFCWSDAFISWFWLEDQNLIFSESCTSGYFTTGVWKKPQANRCVRYPASSSNSPLGRHQSRNDLNCSQSLFLFCELTPGTNTTLYYSSFFHNVLWS